ncbi:MAG: T9SS type A sorting domain-containing protein [Chitinophagales bacterium]
MRFLFLLLAAAAFPASAQNILISDALNPNEPSIMFNPKDPAIMIAGSNLNSYYLSSDTGKTWTQHLLTSSFGVWGDPVIEVDTAGVFYFFHLSNPPGGNWIDRIVCQKTEDNGATWNDGSFTGLNGTKAQDKQWSSVNAHNNHIFLTWTQFDQYGSFNPADSSIILFSRSFDQGETWSEAKRINQHAGDCIDSDNTVEGATSAVGPDGELYVVWAGPDGLIFDRSYDEGDTWLDEDIIIGEFPGGWDYAIPGLFRCNGLPILKCDTSGGPNNGTLYLNWTDQRNGEEDTDVWLAKSTDGGDTWSDPVRVNDDDAGKQQFMTWMDVDQVNGHLFFVFYDRRNYDDNRTDVYVAYSFDGGETFTNERISDSPFTPNEGVFFGDYTNIAANDSIVRPIWTRLEGGQLTIWTHDVKADYPEAEPVAIADKPVLSNEVTQYPNPTENMAWVSFKIHGPSEVSVGLYDQQGKLAATIIDQQGYDYGKYVIPVQLGQLGLQAGSYIFRITINGQTTTRHMVVIQ